MTDIHQIVDSHSKTLQELQDKQLSQSMAIDQHTLQIAKLDENMTDIKERFGSVATHKDVLDLHTKIDASVNGVLRDALNAVPQHAANQLSKSGNVWLSITAIVTIIMLALALNHH